VIDKNPLTKRPASHARAGSRTPGFGRVSIEFGRKVSVKTGSLLVNANNFPIPEGDDFLIKRKAAPPKSDVGFLMLDPSLNLISFNTEAVRILGYPNDIERLAGSAPLLSEEIRSKLINWPVPGESVFATEFRSGRRRYFCRAFTVDSSPQHPVQPTIAMVLERGPSRLVALAQACEQFNLTRREQEVLEYLLQGMGGKEIAKRMNVSPNTVKAFVRLIMIKMGVSSRSAIVGKVVMMQG
jgi:DNA-binding CsgD family transcriptional regulator